MDAKIKNYLGVAIIFALLVGTAYSSAFVYYYSISTPFSSPNFYVTGEAKTIAVPDIAKFTFDITDEGGMDMAVTQNQNTERADKIFKFIKSQDVDSKDIKTAQYSIAPRYQYYSCPTNGGTCPSPLIIGYTIRQTLQVKIRAIKKAGEILAGVAERGADWISELSFSVDDPSEFQNKVRGEAVANAKKKAISLAGASGFRLGRLLSISENSYLPHNDTMTYGKGGGGGGASSPPQIEPGSQEISVQVTVQYEMK